jgi:hypothetical protein
MNLEKQFKPRMNAARQTRNQEDLPRMDTDGHGFWGRGKIADFTEANKDNEDASNEI